MADEAPPVTLREWLYYLRGIPPPPREECSHCRTLQEGCVPSYGGRKLCPTCVQRLASR
jgi:hypothetical protein